MSPPVVFSFVLRVFPVCFQVFPLSVAVFPLCLRVFCVCFPVFPVCFPSVSPGWVNGYASPLPSGNCSTWKRYRAQSKKVAFSPLSLFHSFFYVETLPRTV
jgi:hypothetical protein